MGLRKKRVKVYSVFGVLIAAVTLTLPNISWKTDRKKEVTPFTKIEVIAPIKIDYKEAPETNTKAILFINYLNKVYEDALLKEANLALPVFEKAIIGFHNLSNNRKLNQEKQIITVIDFTRPSSEKRMWIIDLKNNKLLLSTYVAHGQGSGENLANSFSNIEESHQSSLGFYVTSETYIGKHGLSLKLDGHDKGINDRARSRAIVVHGASYVSESFIKATGRLGRSFGCPAVPVELNDEVIRLIKDKTCMFINGNTKNYQSTLLNQEMAYNNFSNIPQS
jgi:hypothetical protein